MPNNVNSHLTSETPGRNATAGRVGALPIPETFALAPSIVPIDFLERADPNVDTQDKAFHELARMRMTQARMRCVGCGFGDVGDPRTPEGVTVMHHLNHDHSDNRADNLFPICPVCHDIVEIGFNRGHEQGEVLFGDAREQADLVNVWRAWAVAYQTDSQYADTATAMYEEVRTELWRTTQSAMPSSYDGTVTTFATLLQSGVFQSRIKNPKDILRHVRYLPFLSSYEQAITHWNKLIFTSFPAEDWLALAVGAA